MGVIIPLDVKIEKLLSKTEAMVLLCSKASGYWSMIKFCFNIPLVFTSSAMCVINSIVTLIARFYFYSKIFFLM